MVRPKGFVPALERGVFFMDVAPYIFLLTLVDGDKNKDIVHINMDITWHYPDEIVHWKI